MWQKAPGVGEAFGLGVAGVPPAPLGQFDTDLAPERERADYYRAMLRGLVCAATPILDPEAPRFRVRTRNGALGEALYVHYSATAHQIERNRRDTEIAQTGCYFLLRQAGEARSFLEVAGEEHWLEPGDCLLGDADAPFFAREAGPLAFSLYLLPKWLVEATLTNSGRDRLAKGVATTAGSPLGALVDAWLAAVPVGGLSPAAAAGVGGALGRLCAVVAEDGAAPLEPDRAALRAARAQRVLQAIDRGFADLAFGPTEAAAGLGISVR